MIILGIETSCDETAAAVVKDGREIISSIVASQIALHKKTGGVVPEVAAREHVVKIVPVINEALKKAGIGIADIDAVAVTAGPGLLSSLLIGVNAAMTISKVANKPLIPVNHIAGHIYANWLGAMDKMSFLRRQESMDPRIREYGVPEFPLVVLTVSGGHNDLVLMRRHAEFKVLGTTIDDAAGEAFDKVARILGLPYPGGPAIQEAAKNGDPKRYPLPRSWLPDQPFNFSFSGLKTAVLYLNQRCHSRESGKLKAKDEKQFVADVSASFQSAVCEVLATKLMRAAEKFGAKEIHLAGGVSANTRLREMVVSFLRHIDPRLRGDDNINRNDLTIRYCENIALCTDNAAMIAAAAYYKFKKSPAKYKKWRPIIADPNLKLG